MKAESILRAMPSTFANAVAVARDEPTYSGNIDTPAHLLNRITYFGDGANRVFCLCTLVKRPSGLHWFFYIMASPSGCTTEELIPVREWTAERQLSACYLRAEIVKVEPQAVETIDPDGEGYLFRGPTYPAQKSEPQPEGDHAKI